MQDEKHVYERSQTGIQANRQAWRKDKKAGREANRQEGRYTDRNACRQAVRLGMLIGEPNNITKSIECPLLMRVDVVAAVCNFLIVQCTTLYSSHAERWTLSPEFGVQRQNKITF